MGARQNKSSALKNATGISLRIEHQYSIPASHVLVACLIDPRTAVSYIHLYLLPFATNAFIASIARAPVAGIAKMSSVDLLSSPDPLQEIEPSIIPSSSRPITRSQASQRFFSLATSSVTPRKRTFELDVGDAQSPQKIFVTVEAGDTGSRSLASPNISRRLFQPDLPTPTPRRVIRHKEKATTTSVPLRGLTDDEGDALGSAFTPRRRGRPPKSGTPVTTARKRPGTPAEKSARRPRKTQSSEPDELLSGPAVPDLDQATPRARKATPRKRSPTKQKTSTPARESAQPPKKRGRPRRQAIRPDEFDVVSQDNTTVALTDAEDMASVAETGDNVSIAGSLPPAPSDSGAEMEDDIWMANLSEQSTPVVGRRWGGRDQSDHSHISNTTLPGAFAEPEAPAFPSIESEQDEAPGDLFMDIASVGRQSPAESRASENPTPSEQDTAAVEDFTMISIGDLPSMRGNSSLIQPDEELGEATSLIISQTLESLRRSRGQMQEETDPRTSYSAQDTQPTAATETAHASTILQPPETNMFSQPKSPQPWPRSPRRAKSQTPLGRQLALKSIQSTEKTASPGLSPPKPLSAADVPQDASMMYEDSFSEIPEAVLEAATPRPARRPFGYSYEAEEEDEQEHEEEEDEEDELDLIVPPSVARSHSTVNSSHPQSETNRLLTPDETPSPNEGDDEKNPPEAEASSLPPSALPSEASRQSIEATMPRIQPQEDAPGSAAYRRARSRTHSRNTSIETPIDTFVSGSSARATFASHRANLAPPEISSRPTLSPIMRAGRALQMVTSDPPSPPRQESLLRSPFRGSVSARSTQSPVLSAMRATKSPTPGAVPLAAPGSAQSTAPPSAPLQQETSWMRAFAPLSHIKNFVVQGAQAFSSPKADTEPVEPASSAPASAVRTMMDDPFAPNPDEASRVESLRNSIFSESRRRSREPREWSSSPINSTKATAPSAPDEDEMSWMPDGPAPRIEMIDSAGSARSTIPVTKPLYGVSLGAAHVDEEAQEEPQEEEPMEEDQYMGAGVQSDEEQYDEEQMQFDEEEDEIEQEQEQEPEPEYDDGEVQAEEEEEEENEPNDDKEEEEEDDIWAIEAQRATPRSSKPAQKAPRPMPFAGRRGKLPSPWRKGDKTPKDASRERNTQPDELSMLSQLSRNESAIMEKEAAQLAQVASAKKMDLSAFFSSPAELPEVQPFGLFKALDAKKSPTRPAPKVLHPFGRFSSFNTAESDEASQRTQASGTLRNTQPGARPNPSFPTRVQVDEEPRHVPQRDLRIGDRRSVDLFSPSKQALPSQPAPSTERSSPATPERSLFAPIPQKQNFTPRQPQFSNSSLFNPSTNTFFSKPAAQNIRPSVEQPDLDDAMDMEYDEEESSFIVPELKPLPGRAASPSKSSLRSPLKAKTRGRVVEFTSSTLSPLQQAQVRSERRTSASPEKQLSLPSNSQGPSSSKLSVTSNSSSEEDKENQTSPSEEASEAEMEISQRPVATARQSSQTLTDRLSAFGSFDPAPLPRVEAPLSRTTWTKAHWGRLDALLQERRQAGALQFQLRNSAAAKASSRRASRKLLGKQLSSNGEAMTLEQWHLDVCDAFQAEVGGWDEDTLARRLFALMVGEERRRKGLVPRMRDGTRVFC